MRCLFPLPILVYQTPPKFTRFGIESEKVECILRRWVNYQQPCLIVSIQMRLTPIILTLKRLLFFTLFPYRETCETNPLISFIKEMCEKRQVSHYTNFFFLFFLKIIFAIVLILEIAINESLSFNRV